MIDAESGEVVSGLFKGHRDFVRSVAFSPDGMRVVSGSKDKTVMAWNLELEILNYGHLRDTRVQSCLLPSLRRGHASFPGRDSNLDCEDWQCRRKPSSR